MREELRRLIERIGELPEDWHGAGSVSTTFLRALADHADTLGPIVNSVETGSGKSTLLFSHLSRHHLVFALDSGESVSQVRASPLFRSETVTFVEGFNQQTLPRHEFEHKFQIVFIDGPHGYPFPDLEYYYLYPHLVPGGLLIIDDTQIPTIRRMVEILKVDAMYEYLEEVEKTAFLRRTEAPLLNPLGDDWWLQDYNRSFSEYLEGLKTASQKLAEPTQIEESSTRWSPHSPEPTQRVRGPSQTGPFGSQRGVIAGKASLDLKIGGHVGVFWSRGERLQGDGHSIRLQWVPRSHNCVPIGEGPGAAVVC